MSGTDLARLFDVVLTDPAPDTTDVEAAMRTVRHRRRVRTGALMLSAAAVVAVIAVVLAGVLDRTPSPPPAASPSALEGVPVTDRSQLVGTWQPVEPDMNSATARGTEGIRFGLSGSGSASPNGIVGWTTSDGCNEVAGTMRLTNGRITDARTLLVSQVLCMVKPPGGGSPVPYTPQPIPVLQADEARLVAADSGEPAQLLLTRNSQVVARYTSGPRPTAPKGTRIVLTSPPAGFDRAGMAALVAGKVTVGNDGCVGLDGRTTVWPDGTRWSTEQDALLLPDGARAPVGATVTGGGGFLPPGEGITAVQDAGSAGSCTWSDEVPVFNRSSEIVVRQAD